MPNEKINKLFHIFVMIGHWVLLSALAERVAELAALMEKAGPKTPSHWKNG